MFRGLSSSVFALLPLLALLLHGCGQTGALYLPGEEETPTVPATEEEESSPDSDSERASGQALLIS